MKTYLVNKKSMKTKLNQNWTWHRVKSPIFFNVSITFATVYELSMQWKGEKRSSDVRLQLCVSCVCIALSL